MPHSTETETLLDELLAGLHPTDRAQATRLEGLKALVTEMIVAGADPTAPSRETLLRLGDRWSPLLLFVLSTGHYRHAQLKRVVNAISRLFHDSLISQRMLTLRLRALERDGLVIRSVGTGKPSPVDYGLTPLGVSLQYQLAQLMQWCIQHGDQMRAAQRAYDAQLQLDDGGNA